MTTAYKQLLFPVNKIKRVYFQFFGSKVLGFVRNIPKEKCEHVDKYYTSEDLSVLLRKCDYICSVLPKTQETTGILNEDNLKLCTGL